jgi:octaprenyl-diphosphate synthase
MSEGELLQIEKSRNLNLDEATYFEIIRGKTASLIASACSAGAFSSSHDETMAEDMRIFGEKIGLAFQIKDDLFDYGSSSIGKPTGNDIKEKKLTLPLIHTLNNCDRDTRKKLIYKIKNHHRNPQAVREIIEVVKSSGGIEYTENKMLTLRDEALAILNRFPNKEVVAALEELVRFTTDRTY